MDGLWHLGISLVIQIPGGNATMEKIRNRPGAWDQELERAVTLLSYFLLMEIAGTDWTWPVSAIISITSYSRMEWEFMQQVKVFLLWNSAMIEVQCFDSSSMWKICERNILDRSTDGIKDEIC